MTYTPVTPFRRTVDAVLLERQTEAEQPLPAGDVNKWEALRELGVARKTYGLSDRDISVLQALLSVHRATVLSGSDDNLIVHPSNKTICERLNGMANSTMRRHLAHLVNAGVILRRDSPNGKRYVRRYDKGRIVFGFDLSPLIRRFREFCQAAADIRAREEVYKRSREAVSLMRRDLAGLAEYGAEARPDLGIWDVLAALAESTAKALRRKLDLEDLERMEGDLLEGLNAARNALDGKETRNMSTNAVCFEQRYQNSKTNSHESEILKKEETEWSDEETSPPNIPIALVLEVCTEFQAYSEYPVRHWHELVRLAEFIRPMMGISPSAWADAKRAMGPEQASVVVVAMLERSADIRSPGGYLRALTEKATTGGFSCGPMVMALMRQDAA